jgi:pseudouridine kinase
MYMVGVASLAKQPSIVVIGGASLDIKGRLRRPLLHGTSNAASIKISIGGVGRNIAENLARLGTSVALVAAVCADDFGRAIVAHTAAAGVDTTHVLTACDQHSASYIAILDHSGGLVAGLDDSAAARAITAGHIKAHAMMLQQADMVVADANLSTAAMDALLEICEAAQVPVAFEPVAYALAERHREQVERFFLVTPNELEAEALTGIPVRDVQSAMAAAQKLIATGVEIVLITLAHQGIVYASSDEVGHIPSIPTEIVDPTGAGDALAATVIFGLTTGIPLAESLRLGHIAAVLTLQSPETAAPDLNLEYLYEQLEL